MADLPMMPAGTEDTCDKFGVQYAKLSELAVGSIIKRAEGGELIVYRNKHGELCIGKNQFEIQLSAMVKIGGDYLKDWYLVRHAIPAERRLILADYLEKSVSDKMFDMHTYFSTTPAELRKHVCGTVGCVAGWAVALFTEREEGLDCETDGAEIAAMAAELLELSMDEEYQLFYDFSLIRIEAVEYLRSLQE